MNISKTTSQKFPLPASVVFANLVDIIPSVGMKMKQKDDLIRRVTVGTPMTLFSWGENISLSVEDAEGGSVVNIVSSLKFAPNLAGMHKHQKNFDKIIYALSDKLKH